MNTRYLLLISAALIASLCTPNAGWAMQQANATSTTTTTKPTTTQPAQQQQAGAKPGCCASFWACLGNCCGKVEQEAPIVLNDVEKGAIEFTTMMEAAVTFVANFKTNHPEEYAVLVEIVNASKKLSGDVQAAQQVLVKAHLLEADGSVNPLIADAVKVVQIMAK